MRKKPMKLLCVLLSAVLLGGCGASSGTGGTQASNGEKYLTDFDVSKYVTLGQYKDIEIEVSRAVTDEEVDEYMEQALSSYMEPTDEDRAVEDGDTVSIDYSGRLADTDEVFDGGTAEDVEITIGAGGYIDGFEDGIIGMKPGETKEVPLTFPEEYTEELAGKDVIFTFTMHHFLVPATEWTDEIVASIGLDDVKTPEELREYMRLMLQESKNASVESDLQNSIMETVEGNCTFLDPPAELLERFESQLRLNAEESAAQYSEYYGEEIDTEEILQSWLSSYSFSGTTDEMVTAYTDRISKVLMMYFAIAKAEGLTVSDAEVEEQLQMELESGEYESVEAMNEALQTDMEKEIRESLTMSLAQEFILHNNYGIDETGNRVDAHTHEEEELLEGSVGADGAIGGE